jgi:hypothetical protein
MSIIPALRRLRQEDLHRENLSQKTKENEQKLHNTVMYQKFYRVP